MARALKGAGIAYHWLGDALGGRPQDMVANDVAIRESSAFREGIVHLHALAAESRTAIMCWEGDHRSCHRHKLITPVLLDRGIRVLHIQPDGSIVDELEEPRQLALI